MYHVYIKHTIYTVYITHLVTPSGTRIIIFKTENLVLGRLITYLRSNIK